jgi:ribose/xylose/arabinose/galactoside ABC-type transport system permease subunit
MTARAFTAVRWIVRPGRRPLWALLVMLAAVLVIPAMSGEELTINNFYDISQNFASLGLVALALALTMIAGEFDIAIPATFLLGSMVAVKFGQHAAALGIALALAAGALAGLAQGTIIAKLKLNSMSVTLGGYLAILGIVYLLGHSNTVEFENYALGIALEKARLFDVISIRAGVSIAVFVAVGVLLWKTRLGPELRAVGADRRSARTAGVEADRTLIAVFVASGMLPALAGALQGYALAYAAPSTSTSPLIFGATAALLGGVSLSGGVGTVSGVAAGVLTLGLLQELLVVLAASEYLNSLVTGGLLVFVALLSAPGLVRRWRAVAARRRSRALSSANAGARVDPT